MCVCVCAAEVHWHCFVCFLLRTRNFDVCLQENGEYLIVVLVVLVVLVVVVLVVVCCSASKQNTKY